MKARPATHFVVVCAKCKTDAVVCLKRQATDSAHRAETAFHRAGWHEDGGLTNKATSRWYCPACARERP
jgi:hypothetical protein